MSFLLVLARYTAKDGESDAVLDLLRGHADATRSEPGCQSFEVFADPEDPCRLLIVERYDDEAAFEAHRNTEHFENIAKAQIIPRLESREVEIYPVADRPS